MLCQCKVMFLLAKYAAETEWFHSTKMLTLLTSAIRIISTCLASPKVAKISKASIFME